MIQKLFHLLSLSIIFFNVGAQNNYPAEYFISPVEIPIELSGTFGELRSNHFHSGIDIRTQEVEGHNIIAIADGYVSRIKVTPGGYGKALYITHPNGYVSVYGHLQEYNEEINGYVKNEQYRRESYKVDLYPKKNSLFVKKGEVIAISGNSGRSGGPHLHFEIRNEANQHPINPLFFGITVPDNNAPQINLIKVFPATDNSLIENKDNEATFNTQKINGFYSLKNKDTIDITGSVYFGIKTYDPFNNGNNKNGVYGIKLLVDSVLVYEHKLESFSFSETRYINSLIDYKEYKQLKRRVQKTFIEPNNHLSIYGTVKNKGIVHFDQNKLYQITYIVYDFKGNESVLNFWVMGYVSEGYKKHEILQGEKNRFYFLKSNQYKTDNFILEVPGKALYNNFDFEYSTLPKKPGMYSEIHQVHYDYVPLQYWSILKIKPDSLPESLRNKVCLARIDKKNKISFAGGKWENGFVSTRIRDFGNYCIVVDTIAPEITPINFKNNKILTNQSSIRVKITDEFSGIDTYRGTLNGQWILMEYDEKNDLLIYHFDDLIKKGENLFQLEVYDNKSNFTTISTKLIY